MHSESPKSFAGCFDTGVFDDVLINDYINKLTLTLRKLEAYVALSEIRVYIGSENSTFVAPNLEQDSSRTWLVFNDPEVTQFEVDELDIRGHAHLGIQSSGGKVDFRGKKYKGDFTGTFHVGKDLELHLDYSNDSVIPFSLRSYQVGFSSYQLRLSESVLDIESSPAISLCMRLLCSRKCLIKRKENKS